MAGHLGSDELDKLLHSSRERNAERGVTGLLLVRGSRVLQMLEGEESVVRSLYDRIRMDTRHTEVVNVWSSRASERRFPDWTMGFEDLDDDWRATTTGDLLSVALGDAAEVDRQGSEASKADLVVSGEQRDYVERRTRVLRRALASGDRLVGALGIILNGHDPRRAVSQDGQLYLQCRVCQTLDSAVLDAYPCATAKNALWALEAAGPR